MILVAIHRGFCSLDYSILALLIKEVSGFAIEPPIIEVTDTSEFMRIDRGQVIRLEGKDYLVRDGDVIHVRFNV